jgi:nicotinamide mononucleotide (NMN) deamidase PncC
MTVESCTGGLVAAALSHSDHMRRAVERALALLRESADFSRDPGPWSC